VSAAVSRGSAADELAIDAEWLSTPVAPGEVRRRWYLPSEPAVVLGLAQVSRGQSAVIPGGPKVIGRSSGGGPVLLDDGLLCLTVLIGLPHPGLSADVTESYQWLGEALTGGLVALGVDARCLGVAEARGLNGARGAVAGLACYAGVSPYEVSVGDAKVVGLAQVRRRDRALFQVGVTLRSQAALVELLVDADPALRRFLSWPPDLVLPDWPRLVEVLDALVPSALQAE
jgi:lipoate-protein ligase A